MDKKLVKILGCVLISLLLVGCGKMKDANKIQQYIENNQNDEAIAMIEAGYDVNQVDSKAELLYSIFTQGDHETETPLYTACRVGNKEMIFYLLENGADPNLKNEACEYPLEEYLVEHMGEDDGIIEAFVDAGVDLNLGRTATPFCVIMNGFSYAEKDYQDIYEKQAVYMLEHGANWQCVSDSQVLRYQGCTPLHFIAFTDRVDTLERFLAYDDAKKTINEKDDFGNTAIMYAARMHQKETYQMLLDNGADPTIADKDGKTAEDYMNE